MKKHLLIVISAILLSSCIGSTSISTPQTVAINQGNFKFIRQVSASTSAFYFLGIVGGLSQKENADVVEILITEAQLQPYQALADIRIKTTYKFFLGIIIKKTLTASATIVEFFNHDVTASADTGTGTSSREAKLARLREINASLSEGSTDNIESIISEICDIEEWYDKNGCYKLAEWNELKKVKDFIQKR
ncbi:MAG: hypothetical protein IJZ22_07245 [Bacteroidaceae bacterium]|nr:hypothetical protein [Bacteroidaceae bacterium]